MPSLSLTSKLAQKMAEVDSRAGFLNGAGARLGTLLALPTALIDVAGHVAFAALKILPAIPGTIANGVAHLLHKHGKIERKWSTEWSIGGLLKNLAQAVKHLGTAILGPLVGIVSPKSLFKGFFPAQAKLAKEAKLEREFNIALQANKKATKAAAKEKRLAALDEEFANAFKANKDATKAVAAAKAIAAEKAALNLAAKAPLPAGDDDFDSPEVKAEKAAEDAQHAAVVAKLLKDFEAKAAAEKAALALAAASPLPAGDDDFDAPEVKAAAEKAALDLAAASPLPAGDDDFDAPEVKDVAEKAATVEKEIALDESLDSEYVPSDEEPTLLGMAAAAAWKLLGF